MSTVAPAAHKLLFGPAWRLFLLYAVTFGLLLWLIGDVLLGQPSLWWVVVAQAVGYGLVMTWLTRRTGKQADRALGMRPNTEQRLALAQTLKTAKLPDDPKLRKALPKYLDTIERQNRRIRLIGPLEFVLFAGLAVYLARATTDPVWYAFAGLFVAFGAACYFQPEAVLQRIAKLRKALARADKRAAAEKASPAPKTKH